MAVTLDLDDIQGIVARGYRDLPRAAFVLLALPEDRARAAAWLGALAPGITSARTGDVPQALQVAFTSGGLAKLGLPPETLSQFAPEFVEGMVAPHRSRLLGDVEDCAPSVWVWGGPSTPAVDAALLLYARDAEALGVLHGDHLAMAEAYGGSEVVSLATGDLVTVEQFGFRDGISQPIMEGLSKSGEAKHPVRAGEFVLGYANEYGLYTSRPVLDPKQDPDRILPGAPAGSGGSAGRDLGRNGTYLVFRQLAQDVAGFWQFADGATALPDGTHDPAARWKLAAKMVGRWPGGASLVLAPDADDPTLADANNFGYHHADPHGEACPVAAHVRRANPRDSLDPRPGSAKSIAVGNRHRILRRGRAYGTRLEPEAALAMGSGDETDERGLHFMCLNANISRQFEFIQHTWINNPNFAGLHGEPDPLASPWSGVDFRIPASPVRTRVTGIPRFVTVRGGAYFFLPGLRAVRYLAQKAGA